MRLREAREGREWQAQQAQFTRADAQVAQANLQEWRAYQFYMDKDKLAEQRARWDEEDRRWWETRDRAVEARADAEASTLFQAIDQRSMKELWTPPRAALEWQKLLDQVSDRSDSAAVKAALGKYHTLSGLGPDAKELRNAVEAEVNPLDYPNEEDYLRAVTSAIAETTPGFGAEVGAAEGAAYEAMGRIGTPGYEGPPGPNLTAAYSAIQQAFGYGDPDGHHARRWRADEKGLQRAREAAATVEGDAAQLREHHQVPERITGVYLRTDGQYQMVHGTQRSVGGRLVEEYNNGEPLPNMAPDTSVRFMSPAEHTTALGAGSQGSGADQAFLAQVFAGQGEAAVPRPVPDPQVAPTAGRAPVVPDEAGSWGVDRMRQQPVGQDFRVMGGQLGQTPRDKAQALIPSWEQTGPAPTPDDAPPPTQQNWAEGMGRDELHIALLELLDSDPELENWASGQLMVVRDRLFKEPAPEGMDPSDVKWGFPTGTLGRMFNVLKGAQTGTGRSTLARDPTRVGPAAPEGADVPGFTIAPSEVDRYGGGAPADFGVRPSITQEQEDLMFQDIPDLSQVLDAAGRFDLQQRRRPQTVGEAGYDPTRKRQTWPLTAADALARGLPEGAALNIDPNAPMPDLGLRTQVVGGEGPEFPLPNEPSWMGGEVAKVLLGPLPAIPSRETRPTGVGSFPGTETFRRLDEASQIKEGDVVGAQQQRNLLTGLPSFRGPDPVGVALRPGEARQYQGVEKSVQDQVARLGKIAAPGEQDINLGPPYGTPTTMPTQQRVPGQYGPPKTMPTPQRIPGQYPSATLDRPLDRPVDALTPMTGPQTVPLGETPRAATLTAGPRVRPPTDLAPTTPVAPPDVPVTPEPIRGPLMTTEETFRPVAPVSVDPEVDPELPSLVASIFPGASADPQLRSALAKVLQGLLDTETSPGWSAERRRTAIGPPTRAGRAIGAGQIMPDTAGDLNIDPLTQGPEGAARYLLNLVGQRKVPGTPTFGAGYDITDIASVLSAYNQGPGKQDRRGFIPETREYVAKVLARLTPQEENVINLWIRMIQGGGRGLAAGGGQ